MYQKLNTRGNLNSSNLLYLPSRTRVPEGNWIMLSFPRYTFTRSQDVVYFFPQFGADGCTVENRRPEWNFLSADCIIHRMSTRACIYVYSRSNVELLFRGQKKTVHSFNQACVRAWSTFNLDENVTGSSESRENVKKCVAILWRVYNPFFRLQCDEIHRHFNFFS